MQVLTPENKSSGLAYSVFARHYLRNLGWCLFLALLRCFSSGGSPRTPILFNARYWSIAPVGFPIRKSPDHRIFAPPRSLSQLVTSFVGSWCQGIPLALFIAWPIEQSDRFVLSVELCRQSLRVFLTNCIYPSPFGVVPQLNICFLPDSCLKGLSVALLITLIPLFSFQGAILWSASLRSEISL